LNLFWIEKKIIRPIPLSHQIIQSIFLFINGRDEAHKKKKITYQSNHKRNLQLINN